MSTTEQPLHFSQSTAELSVDLTAVQQQATHTSKISYQSGGHCLIIGELDTALPIAARFQQHGATIVQIDAQTAALDKQLTADGVAVFTLPELVLTGYLGAFHARTGIAHDALDLGVSVFREDGSFDLVLDLSEQPLFDVELKPFGYQHVASAASLDDAVEDLLQLVGDFEKPRYFDYQESICAHSRSELNGCQRCVDVCATNAIRSNGEGISVDPFLCQGCGSCATACPSGAMNYAYPYPADAIRRSRELLRDAAVNTLLLHTESSQPQIDAAELGAHTVALQVEEITAFGLDYWLSMLAGHAARLILVDPLDSTTADAGSSASLDAGRRLLLEQRELLHTLLAGLGVEQTALEIIAVNQLDQLADMDAPSHSLGQIPASGFAVQNDKRQTVRLALDAMAESLLPVNAVQPLPATAPFGGIVVDTDACTLCMACVSTCPAKALMDGQDTPALRMVEANCVQCGLCAQACPESAISLDAHYTWDSIQARRITTLHEETPFNCISCNTPFSTQKMMETMTAKLAGHWMFSDDTALRRLRMCGDCRVRDMFEQDAGGINVHKES